MTSSIRRNPIIRALALLGLAIGLFAFTPGTAGALDACVLGEYADTMQLAADPSTLHAGETTQITGTGYPANCTLEVFVDGNSIGFADTDGDGTFTIPWTVPAGTTLGEHVISTNVSRIEVTTNVTVIAASSQSTLPGTGTGTGSTGTGGTALPATGANVLPYVGGAVLLLVVGGLLVLATRKRNATN